MSSQNDPYIMSERRDRSTLSKLWPVLAAVAGVLALVVGILIIAKSRTNHPAETTRSTLVMTGMPRADIERRFSELDMAIRKDLVLTLNPEGKPGEATEEPLVLTLSDATSDVHLDLVQLAADLNTGVGREAEGVDSYVLDPRDYLAFDEASLRAKIDEFVAENGTEFSEASMKLEDVPEDEMPTEAPTEASSSEEESSSEEQPTEAKPSVPPKMLVIQTSRAGRKLDANAIFQLVTDAYAQALIAEKPEEAMRPSMSYEFLAPKPVDVEALWKRFCKDPVEPELDTKTGEVKDGKDGFGFDREALQAALAAAGPGEEVKTILSVLKPTTDAEELRASLFKDVLGEAHTNHTAVYNRTNNLILACEAINGTILLPGEEFSFNRVVGQRTPERGYREALVYVGNESKPEVGGGVCQVASTIYYAVLHADLKTTERAAHTFAVDYVPLGMDATVYWGSLDYKFENSSPYPIKIEASVSDGQVHVVLLGTEWKDYTVTLDYKLISYDDFDVVEKEVPNDGTYYNGEVITTGYVGYKVVAYKYLKDNVTGKEEEVRIGTSTYNKRDKVIAKLVEETTPPTEPTEPTTPPTEPTEPTTPPTEPTTPPTEPPTEPTEPPTEPTEPPTEPTEPPTEPTEAPTEPTEAPVEPEPDGN
ncbi:MAG: VanW family protein [Oscillospiraceae bacterium]|nr:VanW family protein [Oscillospiraceae bacterium]